MAPQLRPCGACSALVDPDDGCEHWKPALRAVRAAYLVKAREKRTAEDRARANAQKAVQEFYRTMRLNLT